MTYNWPNLTAPFRAADITEYRLAYWLLLWLRLQRFLTASGGPGFTALTLLIAATTLYMAYHPTSKVFLALVIGVAIIWLFQTWAEYVRRTYDLTAFNAFQTRWDSRQAQQWRARAAKLLKSAQTVAAVRTNREALSDADDTLDLIEEIAFYVVGNQVSPEAAHHHLWHWIRGYWFSARNYIGVLRKNPSTVTVYEYIEKLYGVVSEIETERSGCPGNTLSLDAAQIDEFLTEEMNCVGP